MQINKVSIKSEKIHLEYSKRIPKASGEFLVDDYSMTCSEPAVQGFYDTLHSLRAYVCEICDLPEEYQEGMKVIGVTFTYDDENWGAVISAIKTLKSSNTPFNIHTPWKEAFADQSGKKKKDPGPMKTYLSSGLMKALDLLKEHAIGYAEGTRAQGQLPFSEPKKERAR
jgi:hypothetical protein